MIKEKLLYSDSIVSINPSLINPNKTQYIMMFYCPNCQKPYPYDFPKHGVEFQCECGLIMVRYGNSLNCRLDKNKLRLKKLKRITK